MSTVSSTSNVTMGNVSDLINGTNSTKSTTGTESSTSSLANKEVFLQLLVAQLKNQDPESPADGTAFVTQLAQFTQLEQTMGSRKDVASILEVLNSIQYGAGASATQSGDTASTGKTSSSSASSSSSTSATAGN